MLPEPPPPDLHQDIRALLLAARTQVRQTVNTAMVQTQGGKEKRHISKLNQKDFFRDPYVLEFLGAPAVPALYEKDLEQGLLDQLQTFLLELGKGFAFVARQKHVRVEGEVGFIDLVFYNYLLKCFVLVDLKVGKLAHQDVGQMDIVCAGVRRTAPPRGRQPDAGADSLLRAQRGCRQVFAAGRQSPVVCQQIPSGHADRGGVASGVGAGQGFVGNE
jgi:predicted nuclease of restriction endonuclease-like (RecB) superfamily